MTSHNLSVLENGHLAIGGIDTEYLVKKYGTPLYVMNEDVIRENANAYIKTLKECAPEGSMPFFASKSCSFKEIYRIISKLGIGTDLVSPGEIYTAKSVGFDLSRSMFHGNCKTDADIRYAMDCGVGYFVSDTFDELNAVKSIAKEKGIKQKVLIRLTPGIDVHTHDYIKTGKLDSKFGFSMFDDDALKAVNTVQNSENLVFSGFHCHIGSQLFELEAYYKAVDVILEFISENKIDAGILNIGGGFGIAYTADENTMDIVASLKSIISYMKNKCTALGISMPILLTEPGRSIVGSAGTTLYTVGSVKEIKDIKNYVAIDGGMADNPRYALYKSRYTCYNAYSMNKENDFLCTIAGRCCESGDLIQENVTIPKPERGSVIAVCDTGAYNYSMSSNYNRLCRPAVVIISNGNDRIAVERESYEHMTALDN